jgi:hypothetical protein
MGCLSALLVLVEHLFALSCLAVPPSDLIASDELAVCRGTETEIDELLQAYI